MKTVHTLIGLFLSLALYAHAAGKPSIREQEIARARELMGSSLVNERAWGVYLGGRLHSEELNKLLVEEFRPAADYRDSAVDSERYAFVSVLFDAAIESRLRLPGELLEPFFKQWPGPVLMLLSWSDNNEELLMKLRWRADSDEAWFAINNLLYKQKSQEWYASILHEIHLSNEIVVSELGTAAGDSKALVGGGMGDGFRKMPAGFPPVPLFSLQNHGVPGALLLAEGPTTIYLERSVFASNRQFMTGSTRTFGNKSDMLVGYLALMASERIEEVRKVLHRESHLRYTNNAYFERDIARLRAEQEGKIRLLIRAAARQGMTAPDVELRIVPKVFDRRTRQSPPLPAVGDWVFTAGR